MSASNPIDGSQFSKDLLALYDEFSDFDACCSFFCDAVASVSATREECLDHSSADGLRIFAQQLKERSAALKGEVEAIWKAASSQDRH